MNDNERTGSLPQRIFENSIVLIIIVVVWLFVPLYTKNLFLPSLFSILESFRDLALNGELWLDIVYSLRIVFAGLLIAASVAVVLGMLLGRFARLERYLDPTLQIMRNTPVLAILPVFILFLGIGDSSKIAIVIWATFFPTLLNTIQGAKNVDANLIRSAQSMGISSGGLFFKVILPAASPFILAGFRLSAGVAMIVIVAAEMVGAQHGLGFMIFNYQHSYQTSRMYVGILTLAIIGVFLNFGLVKLEKHLTRWQEKTQ
ncbi:MAG: ABC transporter permease [Clostridiales Family XIII bacterium]|jgi:NitT/TauT family transport system permease protein|nr:ABC transporter permease [Clostridiales Family XIII bacterium]